MDKLRLDIVAVRVVAWHNRHPLARRIGVQHLQSIGYVALPFRAAGARTVEPTLEPAPGPVAMPQGATLRERAAARARQGAPQAAAASAPPAAGPDGPLEAAFTENIVAPLPMARLLAWVRRHGSRAPVPADAPLRRVDASGGATAALHAMTALIDLDGRRRRVLVGVGEQPAVLGQRLLSPLRLGALVAALVALGAGGAASWLLLPGAAPPVPAALPASAPGSAPAPAPASSHSAASAPAPAPAASGVAAAASEAAAPAAEAALPAAAVPASAPLPASPFAAPVDVEPRLGRVELPPLGLPDRRAPRVPRGASAPESGAAPPPPPPATPRPAAPVPQLPAPPVTAPPVAAPPVAAPRADQTHFGVSTRKLRTRAESEQIRAAMEALLAGGGTPGLTVTIVPAGEDFRVVGWPFPSREGAERARALLSSRGMRVEVIDF